MYKGIKSVGVQDCVQCKSLKAIVYLSWTLRQIYMYFYGNRGPVFQNVPKS